MPPVGAASARLGATAVGAAETVLAVGSATARVVDASGDGVALHASRSPTVSVTASWRGIGRRSRIMDELDVKSTDPRESQVKRGCASDREEAASDGGRHYPGSCSLGCSRQ